MVLEPPGMSQLAHQAAIFAANAYYRPSEEYDKRHS